MDVVTLYAEFLKYFLALIVVGVSLKYRFVDPHKKEPVILMGKRFGRHQINGFGTVAFLGVVIQVVANTINGLQDLSVFQDPVIGAGFGTAFLILVTAK
ncbi:hypothetical protein [Marinicella gelatinilytica]|uniref:hypothetical protein n=1 Tax=Marinicella gelatinilytica TaxID=2996017 RepID=UPI002260C589|nr:hypothetical protein [Marinicella gelatinilytica]MCX7544387.1 hypothetical protein [Marinicella gelatinilytica]